MRKFFRSYTFLWLFLSVFFLGFLSSSCVSVTKSKRTESFFKSVQIEKIFDCDCDIRALNATSQNIFFGGSNGKYGYLNTADYSVNYLGEITRGYDQKPDFRGLAQTGQDDFILSAGNPAVIYKVNRFGQKKFLFRQDTPGTFYDAIAFWNENEGLIIGDPIADCMSFLITRDAGITWTPVDCDVLGKAEKGEAAFAASNTNIAIQGDETWVISGGKTSRVYYSADKGKSWKIYETPLLKGKETGGAYSVDFYDSKTGIIVGGDFTDPEMNSKNTAMTTDGGKIWYLIADQQEPGYKSAVKFVPNSNAKEIVSVGTTGVSYSQDSGQTWIRFSDQALHNLVFVNDFTAFASGKGGIFKLTFTEDYTE